MPRVSKSEAVTWVEVDLGAVRHNIREVRRHTRGMALMPVVKAHAYGHGLVPIAKECEKNKVEYLAVISVDEALEIRKAHVATPILVLAYVGTFLPKIKVQEAIRKNIDFTVFDKETAHFLNAMAAREKKKARIHIKVDTGTTRIGLYPKEFFDFYSVVEKLSHVTVMGVFTHFANAEEDPALTLKQASALRKIQMQLLATRKKVPYFHAAATGALLTNEKTYFSLCRLGIGLYGLWPSDYIAKKMRGKVTLKPALSWKTKVIQVKKVKKGSKISYGGTYTAPHDIMVAVIACGYADGLDRAFSNKGHVLINGKKAPIRGRVCMNITMVEVTGIPKVHAGTKVTLIGKDGEQEITAEDLAAIRGTINYEIVTQINWTIPRFYKKS